MSTITESVDVDVDLQTAYDQWTQFETFPQFMEGVESIKQLDDTHLRWNVKVGPVTREFNATVTEQHPSERIAWHSDEGPEHAGVVTFEPITKESTKVTVEMTMDPEGFVENVADKAGVLDHRVKGDMKNFKKFIESREGAQTGGWHGEVN